MNFIHRLFKRFNDTVWTHYSIVVKDDKVRIFVNGKEQKEVTLDFWANTQIKEK